MGVILDISHHQPPSSLNYDKLAKEVSLVIIRTQYGSRLIDKYYKTHHKEFQKRGIPTAAYAWVRGINNKDMEQEAIDFYNRTKEFKPTFWFLDVEEKSMANMRSGTSAYLKKLRSLGAKKVGIYVAHHLYNSFNLDLSEADAVWIPRYGTNNGKQQTKPSFTCDLWQYTSQGKLNGYNGPLDLSTINSSKSLAYFTSASNVLSRGDTGSKVKKLQQDLLKLGYSFGEYGADGSFGPVTEKTVKKFQKDQELEVDGVVGEKTLAKINALLKKEDKPVVEKDNHKPDPAHAKAWEKAQKKKGKDGKSIFDGTNPHKPLTREQAATILDRLGLLD